MAPRPTPDAEAKLPIIVAGTLRTASGLGEAARLCHDALEAAGLPVFGVDLTASLMQLEDQPDVAFADGRDLLGAGTILLFVNAPVVPLALLRLGRPLIGGKRIVGNWAWELPGVPAEWRRGADFVHDIWVPSRFTADAVRPIAQGRAVHVVPHPVAGARPNAPVTNQRDPRFTVLSTFNVASSFERKNPLAAVAAFRAAFGDDLDVRLVLKGSNLDAYPDGAGRLRDAATGNVTLIDRTLSPSEMLALYDSVDVVLSLHRSEGFGLTIAEGMIRGLPVVATDWSGSVDFVSDRSGIPVPVRLVPARDPQGIYEQPGMVWAEPNVEAAGRALRRLRDDPAWAKTLGEGGASFAERTWRPAVYAELVRELLFGAPATRQS